MCTHFIIDQLAQSVLNSDVQYFDFDNSSRPLSGNYKVGGLCDVPVVGKLLITPNKQCDTLKFDCCVCDKRMTIWGQSVFL